MSWWQRIGGPTGITLQGWLLLAPISIIFTVEVVPEGYLEGWSRLDGYIVGTASHLATGLVLLLGKWLVSTLPSGGIGPVATVVVMAVAGATRGLTTAYLLELFQITAQADYLDRIASGAALIVIWFTAIAVVVDSRKRYRTSFAELTDRVEQQRQLRERGSEILAEREQQLLDQVRNTLREALRVGSKTDEIHNAVDQLVRPLAHQMDQNHPILPEQKAKPKVRIKFWPIARSAFTKTPFSAGPVIFVSVAGTLYSKLWQLGFLGFVDSVLSALLIWSFFALGRKLKLYGWGVWVIWLAAGISSGLLTGLFTGVDPFVNPVPAFYLSVNVVIPAIMVAFLKAYDYQAESNLAALREILESVQWETVALRQQGWVQQKRIARFVHSDLQARLRAFALRLEFSGSEPRAEDIEALRNECEASLALGGDYQDFGKFITELRALWEGVVQIDFEADPDAMQVLVEDGFAQIAMVEIVREAVSNSVKHGRADQVQISISQEQAADRSTLVLTVKDNGAAKKEKTAGLGSKVLSELTLDWNLTKSESGAVLEARVPVRQLEPVS